MKYLHTKDPDWFREQEELQRLADEEKEDEQ